MSGSGLHFFRRRFIRPRPSQSKQGAFTFQQPSLTAGAGALTLAGQSTLFNVYLTATYGTLTLTAQAITLNADLTSGAGTLTLTGGGATLSVATLMAADKGDLTLTGQSATFAAAMTAGAGTLTATGYDIALAYVSDPGTLTLFPKDSAFVTYMTSGAGALTLSGQAAVTDVTVTMGAGTLTLTGANDTNFELRPPDGASGNRRKGAVERKEVRLRKRTIEIEKDGRKKKVGYVDRFAPPPPPPPFELIPDWLAETAPEAPEQIEPIEFPTLGYSDPLALKAEIEDAEDERDAIEAMTIIAQGLEDPAIAELNAFLAQLSQ